LSKKARIVTVVERKAVATTPAVTQRHANSRAKLSATTLTKNVVRRNASLLLQELSVDPAPALVIPRRSAQVVARRAPRMHTATTAPTAVIIFNAHLVSVHHETSSAERTTRTRHLQALELAPTAVFCLAKHRMVASACSETRTSLTAHLAVAEVNARMVTARALRHGKRFRTGSRATRTLPFLWDVFLPRFLLWSSVVAAGVVSDDAWLDEWLRSGQLWVLGQDILLIEVLAPTKAATIIRHLRPTTDGSRNGRAV
jgi:hypothetical protein